MALLTCPECSGMVSDKAFSCPHCGYPLKSTPAIRPSRKGRRRRPNGSGTVVKLSGNRKKPFQVRVNTRLDDRGYPEFDILGNYEDQVQADIALAKYNENPYDVNLRSLTFTEVYERWYRKKFNVEAFRSGRKKDSEYPYRAAYAKCVSLHNLPYSSIRTDEMQEIMDNPEYSHATTEYISLLLKALGRYALQFDITPKDYAQFLGINKEDDDEHGIPFSDSEIKKLWKYKDKPFVDTVLIYIYSGWRINELAKMPLKNIDLQEKTFCGGNKTQAGRNRIVPIHSAIYDMVRSRYLSGHKSLIYFDDEGDIAEPRYREYFAQALLSCGIREKHTPHDCRHTFNSLLDSAGVNKVCKLRLMGHAGSDINEKIYTHKTLDELRYAVEKISVP